MSQATYLIFGDLHGRVLPAFRLAMAWGREHGVRIDGLLQVGDLGYFPDHTRLDKATIRHAAADPMELGVQLVTAHNREADEVFHGAEEPAEVGKLIADAIQMDRPVLIEVPVGRMARPVFFSALKTLPRYQH